MKRSILSVLTLSALLAFNTPALANETNPAADTSNLAGTSQTRLDINSATLEQLTAVKGLGKSKAQAIIQYRELNGKITEIEQLKSIKGIGKKTLVRIMEKFEVIQ